MSDILEGILDRSKKQKILDGVLKAANPQRIIPTGSIPDHGAAPLGETAAARKVSEAGINPQSLGRLKEPISVDDLAREARK